MAEAGEMAAEVVAEDEVVLVVAVAVVEVRGGGRGGGRGGRGGRGGGMKGGAKVVVEKHRLKVFSSPERRRVGDEEHGPGRFGIR